MSEVDRSRDGDSPTSVDNLIVSLRAYVTRSDLKLGQRKNFDWKLLRQPPSDWVLVFGCETRTSSDQRLRFGAYQLRNKGRLFRARFLL